MSRSPSPRPSATSSSSPPPTPSESRINLPPNTVTSDSFLEGDSPNVLADRALGLHSRAARPREENNRRLFGFFGGGSTGRAPNLAHGSAGAIGRIDEQEGLLQGMDEQETAGEDETDVDEGAVRGGATGRAGRSSRSRSKSQRRQLPWYKKASPIWFLPTTLMMSLSIGMTIAPRLEIFTQLVCRSIGVEKSGVSLPPPLQPGEEGPTPIRAPSPPSRAPGWAAEGEDMDDVLRFVEQATSGGLPGEKDDDTWSKQCSRAPEVQKGVARLATILTLLMGILSALTTGYWGALSDRRGRKPILALALFGTIFMDMTFLIVVNFHSVVGYNFLLVGPAFDGLLGGMTTAAAAMNAYLSDCTESGSRARIFAIVGGLLFGGIAIGPTLGALVTRLSGSLLSPFYLALTLHMIYFLLVLFAFPESISASRQLAARRRHTDDLRLRAAHELEEDLKARDQGREAVLWRKMKRLAARPWGFLRPLSLLLPKKRDQELEEDERPVLESRGTGHGRGYGKWEWELTKVALGYAAYVMVIAVMGVKIQYTRFKFGWTAEENGYYLSFVGACRVVVLILLLPVLIKIFRKPAPLPRTPRPESPLIDVEGSGPVELDSRGLTKEQNEWDAEASYLRVVHDSHFDLFLARMSVIMDIFGYTFMALNHGSSTVFLVCTAIQSFGGAASPAMQSLALAHASPRDAGRLFASLSVLQSISAQVVGPVFFGLIYINSVARFPELMFWCVVGLFVVSFVMLLAVRLRTRIVDGEIVVGADVEDAARRDAKDRGRSLTRRPGKNVAADGGALREEE